MGIYQLDVQSIPPMACADIAQAIGVEIACRPAIERCTLAESLRIMWQGKLVLYTGGGEFYGQALPIVCTHGISGQEDVGRIAGAGRELGIRYSPVGGSHDVAYHPA